MHGTRGYPQGTAQHQKSVEAIHPGAVTPSARTCAQITFKPVNAGCKNYSSYRVPNFSLFRTQGFRRATAGFNFFAQMGGKINYYVTFSAGVGGGRSGNSAGEVGWWVASGDGFTRVFWGVWGRKGGPCGPGSDQPGRA